MRLVYIANIRLPTEKAHGLQIMKTCEALAKQGVEVELVVPRRLNAWKEDPFVFYGIAPLFKITRLWCLDIISLKFFGRIGYWLTILTFYWSARRYVGKQNNQSSAIYYTRDLLVAYALPKKLGPLFYEVHVLPKRPLERHRAAWEKATGLLVISDALKKELVSYRVPEGKVLVARDAVDVENFKSQGSTNFARNFLKLTVAPGKKIVVYTGHLYDWKGADTLAKAAPLLPTDVEVYLVGGTEDDSRCFASEYHAPNLHIVGWQSHAVIPYWLAAADALVLPTSGKNRIGALYTSPLKLFEYMTAGRPMVVSDLSSIREVVDNTAAVFFTPDDPADLAKKIQSVLNNPAEAKEKAERAYNEVMGKYSWNNRAQSIAEFISALSKQTDYGNL